MSELETWKSRVWGQIWDHGGLRVLEFWKFLLLPNSLFFDVINTVYKSPQKIETNITLVAYSDEMVLQSGVLPIEFIKSLRKVVSH